MKKLVLAVFALISYCTCFCQNETTLYDKDGNASYYIENPTGVIFNFEGHPVAFLQGINPSFNIYNFKGVHLGWYENGLIRDHKGYVSGFKKGILSHITHLEPLKKIKQLVPIKPILSLVPIKPIYYQNFSNTSLDYFFLNTDDISNSIVTDNIAAPYNHPYNKEDFISTPLYKPNFSAIEELLSIKQQEYYEQQRRIKVLESNGYLYDAETQKYLSPEKWKSEREIRQYAIKNALKLFTENPLYIQGKPLKNGRYFAFYMNATYTNPIMYSGIVKVSNQKITSMEGEGHKRKFKNATKITKGMCSADIFDKFGFWENTMTYPNYLFFLMPLHK